MDRVSACYMRKSCYVFIFFRQIIVRSKYKVESKEIKFMISII